MKHRYDKKQSFYWRLPKPARNAVLSLPLLLLLSGAYLLVLVYSPRLAFVPVPALAQQEQATTEAPDTVPTGNHLSIDKLNLRVPFFTGDASALEKGAWHRFPERGNPETGGNFILSAHRFNLGLTPQRTKAKSPFYNLHKLAVDDTVTVQFNNKPYTYQVTKLYEVSPHATHIEDQTPTPRLTLYSCLIAGSEAGRLVVEAEPVL